MLKFGLNVLTLSVSVILWPFSLLYLVSMGVDSIITWIFNEKK